MLFFQQWLIFMLPFRMIISLVFSFFSSISLSASVNSFHHCCCAMFSCTLGCPQVDCSTTFSLLLYFFYNFHLFSEYFLIHHMLILLLVFIFVCVFYRSYTTFLLLLFLLLTFELSFFRPYICGIVVARASFETKGNSVLNTEVPHGLERKNKQVREKSRTHIHLACIPL